MREALILLLLCCCAAVSSERAQLGVGGVCVDGCAWVARASKIGIRIVEERVDLHCSRT